MQGQQQRKRSPLPDEVKERTIIIESPHINEDIKRHLLSNFKAIIKQNSFSKNGYITSPTKDYAHSTLTYLRSVNISASLLIEKRTFSLIYKFVPADKPDDKFVSPYAKEVNSYEPNNEEALVFAQFENLSDLITTWNNPPDKCILVRLQKDTEAISAQNALVALHRSKHFTPEISQGIINGILYIFNKNFIQHSYHIEPIPDKGCSIIYFSNEGDRNYVLNLKEQPDNTGVFFTFVEKVTKRNSQSSNNSGQRTNRDIPIAIPPTRNEFPSLTTGGNTAQNQNSTIPAQIQNPSIS